MRAFYKIPSLKPVGSFLTLRFSSEVRVLGTKLKIPEQHVVSTFQTLLIRWYYRLPSTADVIRTDSKSLCSGDILSLDQDLLYVCSEKSPSPSSKSPGMPIKFSSKRLSPVVSIER